MLPKFLLLTSLLVLAASADAAIDFAPTMQEYTAEGIKFETLRFKDGARQVAYEPPRGWRFETVAGGLQLKPPSSTSANATIQATPLSAPPPALNEDGIAALRQQVLSALPPASQAGTIVGEEQNPIMIEGAVCYAFTLSYETLGQTFLRDVIIANRPDTQLTFKLTAPKASFGALQHTFRASLFSWHWIARANPAAG